jgi:hypothetical protein
VVDPRIYRLAFAPTLIALVVLMFSVEAVPEPVQAPETFAADFDGRRAAASAREVLGAGPTRTPGSDGDEAAADLVAARFGEIEAGKVDEQTFEGSFDGEDVELRNVLLTLPGNSQETIVVAAGRDSARGTGATSSASATGLLLEMADEIGRTSHEKTIVMLSAGGASEGADGIRETLESYPTPELIETVVVIARPGADAPSSPHVLPWSTGPESTSAQLVESAKLALAEETDRPAGQGGFLGGLFRLAFPAGLGLEAAAIADGADAIAISGDGERPPEPADDREEAISEETLTEFGNAVLALVLAVDTAGEPLTHGPGTHLTLAGNLIPGWALALLTLTLLLPAVVTAIDGMARASRRREPVPAALGWALTRAAPFAAALLLLYLLALVGLAPDPAFPFDPGLYGFGWRAAAVIVVLVATIVVVALFLRPFSLPRTALRETLATALGLVASLSVLGLWLINPFLALLCVPLAHVWLLGARPAGASSLAVTLAGVLVSLLPMAAALFHLIERLGLGTDAPWTLLLFVTGGQIGLGEAVLGCLVAGTILGLLALAVPRRRPSVGPSPLVAGNRGEPSSVG